MRSNKNGVEGIGRTEAQIMTVIWEIAFKQISEEVTVRQVYEAMKKKQAYTTIMTIMTNLAKKGLLKRNKTTTAYAAYVYEPTITPEALATKLVEPINKVILKNSALSFQLIKNSALSFRFI